MLVFFSIDWFVIVYILHWICTNDINKAFCFTPIDDLLVFNLLFKNRSLFVWLKYYFYRIFVILCSLNIRPVVKCISDFKYISNWCAINKWSLSMVETCESKPYFKQGKNIFQIKYYICLQSFYCVWEWRVLNLFEHFTVEAVSTRQLYVLLRFGVN